MLYPLPKRITKKFITSQEWKEYNGIPVSPFGLIKLKDPAKGKIVTCPYPRKTHKFPGMMLYGYRGVSSKDFFDAVFGSGNYNDGVLDNEYCTKLLHLVNTFKKSIIDERKESATKETRQKNEGLVLQKRLCAGVNGVSCGKMITNYRCEECWLKLRGAHIEDDYLFEYGAFIL